MQRHDVKRGVIVLVVFFIAIFIILLNCAYIVHAFGISTPYLDNETLKVNAGKNYEYTLTIQNGDDSGYYVDIAYASTSNIAVLRETSYYIPSNTFDNKFYFEINIPKEAKAGDRYTLGYGVKPRVNSSDPVTLGVEIKREINILVVDGTENSTGQLLEEKTPEKKTTKSITDKVQLNVRKLIEAIIGIIILILTALIGLRIWRLSKGIASRFSTGKVTDYTISEAKNLENLKKLLEKMNDDEFNLPEIKQLVKEKIGDLASNNLTHEIKTMSRRQVLRAIDNIKK